MSRRMKLLLFNCKNVFMSKDVKKYNRRELLVHLAKIKQELVDVERYIKGCRMSFLCAKKDPTDWSLFTK